MDTNSHEWSESITVRFLFVNFVYFVVLLSVFVLFVSLVVSTALAIQSNCAALSPAAAAPRGDTNRLAASLYT